MCMAVAPALLGAALSKHNNPAATAASLKLACARRDVPAGSSRVLLYKATPHRTPHNIWFKHYSRQHSRHSPFWSPFGIPLLQGALCSAIFARVGLRLLGNPSTCEIGTTRLALESAIVLVKQAVLCCNYFTYWMTASATCIKLPTSLLTDSLSR